jgi:hypothetical protein
MNKMRMKLRTRRDIMDLQRAINQAPTQSMRDELLALASR